MSLKAITYFFVFCYTITNNKFLIGIAMKFYKNIFSKDIDHRKLVDLMDKLKKGEYPNYTYIISADNSNNYAEIVSKRELKRLVDREKSVLVIGIAKNLKAAKQLLIIIVEEMLNIYERLSKDDFE